LLILFSVINIEYVFMSLVLPQGFKEEIESLIPDEAEAFFSAMQLPPETSIKINLRKISSPDETGYRDMEPVKWCRSGFYMPERPKFTMNPLLHAGAFYVQDASSMIYETLMERIVPMALDTAGSCLSVADLCAAPGGKTTSMINALPDGSFVLANEFNPARAKALRENLLKWGYPDILITNSPTAKLTTAGEAFDIVAVDAPCSGEGMMRKEEIAVSQWSRGLIRQCAELQREILADACSMLKPGGFLIYSTCTFNREEDECQVEWLSNEMGMAAFDPEFPEEWGIMKGLSPDSPSFRFMPHHTRGEGLFLAVMRKENDEDGGRVRSLSKERLKEKIMKSAKVIADGIPATETKGRDEVPRSEWALSSAFPKEKYPFAEVDEPTAISFLRHEALRLGPDIPRGFVVITFKGHPLGIVKNLGSRANNLYPAEWRIRH